MIRNKLHTCQTTESKSRCRSRRGQLLQEFLLSSVIKRRYILTLQSSQEDIINARV
jgi:hypothetical protein